MAEATLVPPGGQYVQTLQAVNHLIDGQVALTATIDNKDLVTEANETNNTLTRTLSCRARPSLIWRWCRWSWMESAGRD